MKVRAAVLFLLLVWFLNPVSNAYGFSYVEAYPALANESLKARPKKQAPEWLKIDVLQVSIHRPHEDYEDVTVLAKVHKAAKSETGLTKGSMIRIIYRRPVPRGFLGLFGGGIPVLKKGERRSAFLIRPEGQEDYLPAAGKRSFSGFLPRVKKKK